MPAEFKRKPVSDMKTVHAGGRDYLVANRAIEGDGIDENGHIVFIGTMCERNMVWEHGGYAYSINASMPEKDSLLAIVSPETAVKLEKDPIAALACAPCT